MRIYLRSTIGAERDISLISHFVEYYRRIGVSEFRFVLHAIDESSTNLKVCIDILENLNIKPTLIWITPNWNTGTNALKHREVVADLPGDTWLISADIDEFHEFPLHLSDFVQYLDAKNIDVVMGRLTERISKDFSLSPLMPKENIFLQFPIQTSFGIGNPGKVMLHRKAVRTTPGHHAYEENPLATVNVYPEILKVMHFKWFQGVGQKYVDPSLMAHHSETWEFTAYDVFIRKNFFGWRRQWNCWLHRPWPAFFRNIAGKARSRLGSKYRSFIRNLPF